MCVRGILAVVGVVCGVLPWGSRVAAQTYFLNGTAVDAGADCYQLTAAVPTSTGAVWYAEQLDLQAAFDVRFALNFGTLDAGGADGIMFVLQQVGTSAIGASGGGLGFLGFGTSFGVEFDTWQNGEYGDPFEDHIGCVSDGSVSHTGPTAYSPTVAMSSVGANVEDGQEHLGRITWDPESQEIQVYFDCVLRLTAQVDLIGDVFGGNPSVFWGFTGSTGGAFNVQTVCLQANSLATPESIEVCLGADVVLNAVGEEGSTYAWEPATYLDDPAAQSPLCTPAESMTYSVTYLDACIGLVTDTVEVEVVPLELSWLVSPPFSVTCATPELDLAVVASLGSGVEFSWSATPPGILGGVVGPQAVVDGAGTVTVSATAGGGACSAELTAAVVEDVEAIAVELTASADQIDCDTPEVLLTATPDAPDAALTWSATTGSFAVLSPTEATLLAGGTVTVTSLNPSNGCTSTASLTLPEDFTYPVVDAGSADTLTCREPSRPILGASIGPPGYSAQWEWVWPAGGGALLDTDSLTPTAAAPGTYTLTVTFPENGCTGSDSLTVALDPEAAVDASEAIAPNVFTPDGDDSNAYFMPFLPSDPQFNLLSIIDRYDLVVFNRWGNEVYRTNGLPVRWDGYSGAGDPLAEGTYYYICDLRIVCGGLSQKTLHGAVELFRGAE